MIIVCTCARAIKFPLSTSQCEQEYHHSVSYDSAAFSTRSVCRGRVPWQQSTAVVCDARLHLTRAYGLEVRSLNLYQILKHTQPSGSVPALRAVAYQRGGSGSCISVRSGRGRALLEQGPSMQNRSSRERAAGFAAMLAAGVDIMTTICGWSSYLHRPGDRLAAT